MTGSGCIGINLVSRLVTSAACALQAPTNGSTAAGRPRSSARLDCPSAISVCFCPLAPQVTRARARASPCGAAVWQQRCIGETTVEQDYLCKLAPYKHLRLYAYSAAYVALLRDRKNESQARTYRFELSSLASQSPLRQFLSKAACCSTVDNKTA